MSDLPGIPLAEPYLEGNALAYLAQCIETNYVSSVGPFVERFERQFAALLGVKYAVACASGTAALHVALRVLGVSAGDDVLVPTLTFVASANAVRYQDAVPFFVDAEPRSWNVDPGLVVEEIRRRARRGLRQPRVVQVVHILGQAANLEPLLDVCAAHDIPIVEDACESLGARYVGGRLDGRAVGTIGRIGCFSFNGNKIITTGSGGMLVTDDEALARRARHLTTHARLPGLEYWHDEVGYNYRLSNIAAALGVAQLEIFRELLARKARLAAQYDRGLSGVPGITTPQSAPWAESAWWLYAILVEDTAAIDRTALLTRLRADGVEARPVWAPLHLQRIFSNAPRLGGEVAERVFARALCLPSSCGLSAAAQRKVIDIIRLATRAPALG
jgi:dTDP-4-amino-4,6-dideoxygalactose transaminase